jgi:hypothetical protein
VYVLEAATSMISVPFWDALSSMTADAACVVCRPPTVNVYPARRRKALLLFPPELK